MTKSLVVRAEAPADEPAIQALHVLAFGGPDEARLVAALRRSGEAEVSLVAEADGQVAGHILLSRLHGPVRALTLAPVAVTPERQRQGIGSRLVAAACAQAGEADWQAIFVLGDPRFYGRLGFSEQAAEGFQCEYAGRNFMMRALGDHAPAPGLIIYPDAFHDL